MKRYHITEGAKTTAGGKVLCASSPMFIDGIKGALEGDPLYCPACKSQGKIVCVGPRIPETWNGKPVALSDDLCVCACPTPPKLLPSQTRKFQVTGVPDPKSAAAAATSAGTSSANGFASAQPSTGSPIFDEAFRAIDDVTGEPIEGLPYRIELADGRAVSGVTDANGMTERVATDAPEEITVIWDIDDD